MNYTVKALSPELAETYTDYLENLTFDHAPHWAGCYCRYYHTKCSLDEWFSRPSEKNREEAVEQIRNGSMKGYLAFDGEKCIGWCNANNVHEYKRLENEIDSIVEDKKVGSIICFVIHPEYRRQGVARLLLKEAVEGFRAQGFEAVLTIPVNTVEVPEKLYRGTLSMYMEYGFEELERRDNYSVMWLKL